MNADRRREDFGSGSTNLDPSPRGGERTILTLMLQRQRRLHTIPYAHRI